MWTMTTTTKTYMFEEIDIFQLLERAVTRND